jgi:hypothetical protein
MISGYKKFLKSIFFKKAKEYIQPQGLDNKWVSVQIPFAAGHLATRYWKQEDKNHPIVILIHPYHKDAKDYFLHSGHPELYYESGYHVVIFDFNGFGESDDLHFEFEKDIIHVASHYKALWNASEVCGHGISFGAAMLIKSLVVPHPLNKAIIENCLDATPNYFKKRSIPLYILMKILFFAFPTWKKSNTYTHIISSIKNPDSLCLIYSEEDRLTTPTMGKMLASKSNIPVQYHLLKGNHMESIKKDTERYKTAIMDYLMT